MSTIDHEAGTPTGATTQPTPPVNRVRAGLRRVGTALTCPRRWLGRHPRAYGAVAVVALAALLVGVYDAGQGAGAAAWQRATDRAMEQQALDSATRPLPQLPKWLPAGTDRAAALAAMRAGEPFLIQVPFDEKVGGFCGEGLILLPAGSLWWLEKPATEAGVTEGWDAEKDNPMMACTDVPVPPAPAPPR